MVHRTVHPSGHPPTAMNMGAAVVTSSSEMIRGLVRVT
jgi:hypothetical protein